MKNYQNYLEKKGYTNKSIQTYQSPIKALKEWMIQNGTTIESIDYKTFLLYLNTLNQKGISKKTIRGYIGSLKHYFNYLQQENYRDDNPIENLKIKGIVKTVLKNILDGEELEDLYHSYKAENGNYLRERNKIILGLLIYQGLRTTAIFNLREENILLSKGKIEIQASAISNARTLELKAWQMLAIQEYLNKTRVEMLSKNNQDTDIFFLSTEAKPIARNALSKLNAELKTYNKNYQGLNQIRSSVIVQWLKIYNLRKTQYMAGHRYISSTERYKQDDLEGLQEMIANFHPIKE